MCVSAYLPCLSLRAPFSPFYLMHGFQPRIKADIKCLADKDDKTLKKLMREMPDLSEYVAARDPKMKSILSALILARREEREKYTALLNTQRLPPKVYNPGDMCVVWRPPKDALTPRRSSCLSTLRVPTVSAGPALGGGG